MPAADRTEWTTRAQGSWALLLPNDLIVVFLSMSSMILLWPMDLPYGHWLYFLVWGATAIGGIFLVHRFVGGDLDRATRKLTREALQLGSKPAVVIPLAQVKEAVPVIAARKAFRQLDAQVATFDRFNILLLRMKDGACVALAPYATRGEFELFEALVGLVAAKMPSDARLSKRDLDAMRPARCNRIQRGGP